MAYAELTPELNKFLQSQGYWNIAQLPDGIVANRRFLFTCAVCLGIDQYGYEGRICYATQKQAEDALKQLKSIDDEPMPGYTARK